MVNQDVENVAAANTFLGKKRPPPTQLSGVTDVFILSLSRSVHKGRKKSRSVGTGKKSSGTDQAVLASGNTIYNDVSQALLKDKRKLDVVCMLSITCLGCLECLLTHMPIRCLWVCVWFVIPI